MPEFQLYLFNPRYTQDRYILNFNKLYQVWKDSFSMLLEASGSTLDPDDFYRSDLILAIFHGDEVVALSTMTHFDLRLLCAHDHHYLKALQPSALKGLLEEQIRHIVSIEYLNVLPKWRKAHSQIRWTEVLIGLGLKLVDQSQADAIIGTPRTDVKVSEVCHGLASREIQDPILKMNYPCAVVVFPKQAKRIFRNGITGTYVEQLLKNAIWTEDSLFNFENPYLKKSA